MANPHHPVRFLYGGSRRNPSLTPTSPPLPPPRRARSRASEHRAAGGLGRNRIEGAGRREEKPHLSRGAAHPLRYSGDRTAPPPRSGRRRGAPKSRIAQAKGEAFSTQFLMGKNGLAALASPGFALLGMFQISDAANGRGTNVRFLGSERTRVTSDIGLYYSTFRLFIVNIVLL